jgi:Beta-lactamase associated winged helix domain
MLGDGPATIPAIVARVYAAVPTNLHAMAGQSVASHLKKLAREGRVREHPVVDAPSRWELF